jgi:predicted nuclease of restriction endonuclease-like (RecB) superfamily
MRTGGGAATNFGQILPAPQSDLAQQTLKDPYIFDFITLDEPFRERELETSLIHHLEKFLLELGQGFAFVGRQYRIEVDGADYFIDLLFYHLKLRAFIVIELKTGAFGRNSPARSTSTATSSTTRCVTRAISRPSA